VNKVLLQVANAMQFTSVLISCTLFTQRPYCVWQLSVATSCLLVYWVHAAHSADCSHVQQSSSTRWPM